MKILSRDFTQREKILILILCLLLLALGYYRFIDLPCRTAISSARAAEDADRLELSAVEAKLKRLEQMQAELDALGALDVASRMPSYNSAKAELSLLNNVLESADSYSVSFANVTRSGEQIRRNFTLQFTTEDFATAKRIISSLTESEYRCLLGDVNYARRVTVYRDPFDSAQDVKRSEVMVNATATFFETMRGGTPDAGLPADSAS